jgi:cell division protein FtsZ
VQGISELVTRPGIINVDFEDLRTVMGERGMAMMGVGYATGDERALKATQKAIANPLLEDISVSGAKGLLVNITSGLDFTLGEFNEVGDAIDLVAAPDARVIIGTSIDESMNDEIRVTVVATGLDDIEKPKLVKPNLQGVQASRAEKVNMVESKEPMAQAVVAEMKQPELNLTEPEVVRPKIAVNGSATDMSSDSNSSYLDIPAFLRRQAD